ncbi:MAG: M61 family metallopeptidase [Cyanobacteriota bacterium]|nr:M61 family metallopeptidase [Cyanobacteriota bacterium]
MREAKTVATEPLRAKPSTAVTIEYQVAMPQPESHLFEVTLHVKGWQGDVLDLKLPVWTPGSYLVREYAKHLQDFQAATVDGKSLTWKKASKNHWQLETDGASEIEVRYRIFASELTVRTNHLDSTHGYFNGAALFFFVPGFDRLPIDVTIVPPQPDWQIATTLPEIAPHRFQSADFDTLVDSPFEIGTHAKYEFASCGKPHEFVVWGQGNLDVEKAIADTDRIIQVEAELFGSLPYDRYLFLLHLSASGFGGLEHKDSCSLNYPRLGFRQPDKYNRFMQLVAHEFFHLWNVKRIRPKALETFDYERENYTQSLWFCEGVTSYYDTVIPYRAKIYDVKAFLKILSQEITRFLTIPGRHVQPLSESSWDAWIKLYRRDANSDNCQISYYLKGEMLAFLLELKIRQQTENKSSLDDVMQQMWQKFGKDEIGFTPAQLQDVFESVAGISLDDFFRRYLHGTEELPLAEYLAPFGLELKDDRAEQSPFFGLKVTAQKEGSIVQFVEIGSPAQNAGIEPGDELLAIDGLRVRADDLNDRLKDYQSGETIDMSFFHQDELRTVSVALEEPRPTRYKLVAFDRPTPEQAKNFEGWLSAPLSSIQKNDKLS